jgi:hypothetical protein
LLQNNVLKYLKQIPENCLVIVWYAIEATLGQIHTVEFGFDAIEREPIVHVLPKDLIAPKHSTNTMLKSMTHIGIHNDATKQP